MNFGGACHCGLPLASAYSTTTPMPPSRSASVVSPRTHTPGWFISTMADTRSAVPIHSTGTSARCGTGLPSSATTLKLWPGSARLRFSVAGIDHVQHHALAALHPDRFTVPQHLAVDRE